MIVPLALTFGTNGISNGTIGGSTIGGTLTDIGIPLVELEAYRTLNPDVPIYQARRHVFKSGPAQVSVVILCKAVVGGTAGPAMAGPLFWPKMVLAGPLFRPIMIFIIFFAR